MQLYSDTHSYSYPGRLLFDHLDVLFDHLDVRITTLFPYGLNDRLEKPYYLIDIEAELHSGACIYKLFPKRVSERSSRGSKKHSSVQDDNGFDPANKLLEIVSNYQRGDLKSCRALICSLNLKQVVALGNFTLHDIGNASTKLKACYYIVLDLCNHLRTRSISFNQFRSNSFKVNQKPVNKFAEFLPIRFVSKELESFDINSILNDRDALNVFPSRDLNNKFSNPDFKFTACYKYDKSIRYDITNYRNNVLIEEPIPIIDCCCHLYKDFINHSVGHVITGDVNIVKNRKLRKLFKKGYSFIEPIYRNKYAIFGSIKSDINVYVKNLASKFSISSELFDGWKAIVLDKLKCRIFNSKISCKRDKSLFVTEEEDMSRLKEHFILTSVDKAANNISFVCKRYYLDNLQHELASTSTYERCYDSEDDIVEKHVAFCKKYDIPVNDRCLPFMHLIPKFHKPSIDFRYIAAGVKSSTKILSKILSGVFKLLDTTVKHQDSFKFIFSNASGYWIAKNKDAATSNLNYLNNASSGKSIYSFDFKKLYTNLPHDKVLNKISDLLRRCFKEKDVEFISINSKFKARWTSVKRPKSWTYKCDDIIDMFKFLLDNIFVKFRGQIYRQIIGIPMGCDCAPQVADLFLFWYEHDYISRGVEDKNPVVYALKFASRYIDDLNTPNISPNIVDSICNDIYPDELDIVQTNTSEMSTTFLDLDISVVNNKFSTKLYDKRRDLKFDVVTFPNLRSKIPTRPSYGVFVGELYRICKSSTESCDFIDDVKLLISKLVYQKFDRATLYRFLKSFINGKPACLLKHWYSFSVSDFF